jgi:hypothetical protein
MIDPDGVMEIVVLFFVGGFATMFGGLFGVSVFKSIKNAIGRR